MCFAFKEEVQSPGIYTHTLHYVLLDGGFKFRRPTVKAKSMALGIAVPLPPHPSDLLESKTTYVKEEKRVARQSTRH